MINFITGTVFFSFRWSCFNSTELRSLSIYVVSCFILNRYPFILFIWIVIIFITYFRSLPWIKSGFSSILRDSSCSIRKLSALMTSLYFSIYFSFPSNRTNFTSLSYIPSLMNFSVVSNLYFICFILFPSIYLSIVIYLYLRWIEIWIYRWRDR